MENFHRHVFSMLLGLCVSLLLLGCSKKDAAPGAVTAENAAADGLVWNPDLEVYEMPRKDGGASRGDGYPAEDEDEPEEQDDEVMVTHGAEEDDEYEDDAEEASASSSNGGYSDGYGEGYGGQQQGDPKYYTAKVEPILRAHCYNCHGGGPRGQKGNVALHSPSAIEESDVLVAHNADRSFLYELVSAPRTAKEKMPPKGPGLSKAEQEIIAKWINDGANFGNAPRDVAPVAGEADSNEGYGGYGGNAGGYGGADAYGGDTPENANVVAAPETLAEWANVSFQSGRDHEAMKQLYAQALVRSDAGKSVLEQYQWYPGLRQAKLAVRWGLGIKYNAKFAYEGAPRPVGVVQNLPGDDFDTVDRDEPENQEFENQTLKYYTGEIGDEVLLRLQLRIENSFYGETLRKALEQQLTSDDDDDDDSYGGGYGGRSSRGGYGGRGSSEKREKPNGDLVERILPGVMMLGEASNSDLMERARKENVDLMIVFDVVADPNNKRKFVDTSTRVRLYDVASEEQLAITGKINNVAIQKLRVDDPEEETIIEEIDKIFSTIDKTHKAKKFPNVTSEKGQKSVVGFVRNLLNRPSEDPLWKLSEVRFYEHVGGLKPGYAEAAYKKILPQLAGKLKEVSTDEEVRSLLAEWLTVDESIIEEDDDDFDDEDDRKAPKESFR